jgi:hypothetical protein
MCKSFVSNYRYLNIDTTLAFIVLKISIYRHSDIAPLILSTIYSGGQYSGGFQDHAGIKFEFGRFCPMGNKLKIHGNYEFSTYSALFSGDFFFKFPPESSTFFFFTTFLVRLISDIDWYLNEIFNKSYKNSQESLKISEKYKNLNDPQGNLGKNRRKMVRTSTDVNWKSACFFHWFSTYAPTCAAKLVIQLLYQHGLKTEF